MAVSLLGLLATRAIFRLFLNHIFCYRKMTAERLGNGAEWKVLERRSVILSGPVEGRTYFHEDFVDGLQAVLTGAITNHVLSFGPLSRNNEWYLCLKTDAVKQVSWCAWQICHVNNCCETPSFDLHS